MLFYHQKDILSMLWNAAQNYSNRKRMQGKSVRKRERKRKLRLGIVLKSRRLHG
jgi:hypothetical protein